MPATNVLALDKWARLFRMFKQSGGFMKAMYKLWRFDALKDGTLMGCDMFGNKYYENKLYMLGRYRWVEYHDAVKWDYDGSQITAEWFGWLHYKTDKTPCDDCAKYELYCNPYVGKWLQPHQENLSATERAYYPYSSVRSHLCLWDGNTTEERRRFEGYE